MIQIPMEKPLHYEYDSLTEDFVFKYAILQEDELVGVLYLEIPYRYKCSKRFKIDDWFIVKPYEKTGISQESTIMARVVLRYNANCKLNQDVLKNIDNLELVKHTTPKKEFKSKIREIGKTFYDHEKEGFQHLEEVEKKIRARRMRGLRSRSPIDRTADKENRGGSANILRHSLSRKKGLDLGVSLSGIKTQQFNIEDRVTPDDLFRGVSKEKKKDAETDRLIPKMAKEMAGLREELASTRAKLKALEEGQMTVDNLQLSKQLDNELNDLNKERSNLLKSFAAKNDKLEDDKKALLDQVKKRELEADKKKEEYQLERDKLMKDRVALDDAITDNLKRKEELDARNQSLNKKANQLKAEEERLKQERSDLADYAAELDELKDNMLRERDNVIKDKARLTIEKEDLESQIKLLKKEKGELEKHKEKELKELNRKRHDLDLREERLNKQEEDLPRKRQEIENQRADLDSLKKELNKAKEEAEEHNLALWRDRNKLNKEVKEFIEDKKMMENDIKWQKEEIQNMYKELDEEKEELDKEREQLEDFEQELENMKLDLEARETQVLNDKDAMLRMKKAFMDKIVESGQYEHMTPEMKKMAKDMGIDIDDMAEEAKRLKERRDQLEQLKKENDSQLQKIKALNSKNNSRRNSRRASLLRPPSFHNELTNMYSRKMAVQEYLSSMYDNACSKFLMKDIEDKRKEALKAKEDLIFANKIIENIRNENKALKRDLDLLSKIVDGLKGSEGGPLNIQSLLGKNLVDKEAQTDLLTTEDGAGVPKEVYQALEQRAKALESKLRRKSLQGKVVGVPGIEEDEEADASSIDEHLKQ